jgi:thiamine-phosphate pyrophosphorylase
VRLPDPPLLLVTDRTQAHAPLPDVLAAAFAAGCRWASLREKDLPPGELVALRDALAPIAARHGAAFTIHAADPSLAEHPGVAGLHLPAGADAAAARAALGGDRLLGISSLVDYVVAGPAFATASKPGYGPALGAAGIAAICAAARVPVVPIGGVAADNIAALRRAGAAGAAVMGGVMRAADPGAAVRALVAAMRAPAI